MNKKQQKVLEDCLERGSDRTPLIKWMDTVTQLLLEQQREIEELKSRLVEPVQCSDAEHVWEPMYETQSMNFLIGDCREVPDGPQIGMKCKKCGEEVVKL